MDKNSSQVCSTDEDKSKSIIVDEISTEEIKSECVQKSVDKEKDANNEARHEEPSITYNSVVKDPRYFNIFKCGQNLLNKLDATS